MDFFCHGVPTSFLWNKYTQYRIRKNESSQINEVSFRDKRNGWHNFTINLKLDNTENSYMLKNNDYFLNFFFR